MPKKSSKKANKSRNNTGTQLHTRNPDDGEEYAEITKSLGNSQFELKFLNGEIGIGNLRGSMKRGPGFQKVVVGNWVIAQLDPCTSGKEKYFITHRYTEKDKKQLERLGELIIINEEEDDAGFVFEGEDEDGVQGPKEVDIDELVIDDI